VYRVIIEIMIRHFKRHLLLFATLLVAARLFLLPGWSTDFTAMSSRVVTVRETVHQLMEFSAEPVPAAVLQVKTRFEVPRSSDVQQSGSIHYKCSDFAKVSYAGGLLGSGIHLRAPPLPLWLLNRSLLL
jgi:hypothetical protein